MLTKILIYLICFVLFSSTGSAIEQPGNYENPDLHHVPAIQDSPVIQDIHWADKSSIVRYAKGADNWPVTWADDPEFGNLRGLLFGAGGDSRGAFSKTLGKHSLIVSLIRGDPTDISGEDRICIERPDIICECGFHFKQYPGKNGLKASGLLFVDGTLYMYVRNAETNRKGRGTGRKSMLAWSKDRGRRWNWGFVWDEFGYPTFINFGMNYTGARDNYVYIASHDSPDAYAPADGFVLMRVPKEKIAEKRAYEFFSGTAATPKWSKRVNDRRHIFYNPGRCQRSGISYNAGIGRYLWWQGTYVEASDIDTRYEGGFGVYDAPEPWGPWTRVYQTDNWDVGPGETGSFPPKWMSSDGKMVHLVFSGNDHFSVRKATLIAKKKEGIYR
jgi:hypothetical protein